MVHIQLLPLLFLCWGGMISDRYIGLRSSIILGSLFLIIGNLLLITSSYPIFCLGTAFLLSGTGLYKSSSSSLVGTLYKDNDVSRDSGFTIFYMGMNLGATLGAIVYGFSEQNAHYHIGFLVSAITIFSSLIVFITRYKIKNIPHSLAPTRIRFITYFSILIFCLLLAYLFYHLFLMKYVIDIYAVVVLLCLTFLTLSQEQLVRNKFIALLVFLLLTTCFFAASLQVTSSISLFIEHDINRVLFHWEIPTLLFSSLYPLSVILTAPFISKLDTKLSSRKIQLSLPFKVIISLLCASIAFIFFALAAFLSHIDFVGPVTLIAILLGNLLLGTGEVILFPSLLSAISRYMPTNFQGTMMGMSFLFVAFGGYLSSVIAMYGSFYSTTLHSNVTRVLSSKYYIYFFLAIALGMCIISIITVSLVPYLKRLVGDHHLPTKSS